MYKSNRNEFVHNDLRKRFTMIFTRHSSLALDLHLEALPSSKDVDEGRMLSKEATLHAMRFSAGNNYLLLRPTALRPRFSS